MRRSNAVFSALLAIILFAEISHAEIPLWGLIYKADWSQANLEGASANSAAADPSQSAPSSGANNISGVQGSPPVEKPAHFLYILLSAILIVLIVIAILLIKNKSDRGHSSSNLMGIAIILLIAIAGNASAQEVPATNIFGNEIKCGACFDGRK